MNESEVVVYVAGPYRAATPWRIQGNIRRAQEVALALMKMGFVALCPHANTAMCDGELPDEAFLSAAMALMRRCDAVFLIQGWESSVGTRNEVELAEVLGIPVFEKSDELVKAVESGTVFPYSSLNTRVRSKVDEVSEHAV